MKILLPVIALLLIGQSVTPGRAIKLPPQAVVLKSASMTYAVPAWGDGKNDDGSYVDGIIQVYSTDGNVYTGFGHFKDGSGITKNGERDMTIQMSGGINQLQKGTITKIVFTTVFWFEGVGIGHSDHWTFRDEAVLTFSDNSIVASGYNDPAHEADFNDDKYEFDDSSFQFYDHRTLIDNGQGFGFSAPLSRKAVDGIGGR